MPQRLNIFKDAPGAAKAMVAVENALNESGLEPGLLNLVKMRASQINGCAFCLHLHYTTARKAGESDLRLLMLDGWRDSSLYTDRERAALAWTETLTLVADRGAPDDVYNRVRKEFSESETANLSMAIGAINLWNRVQIGSHATHPAEKPQTA